MSYNTTYSPLDTQKLNERVSALESNTGSTGTSENVYTTENAGPIYVDNGDSALTGNFLTIWEIKQIEIGEITGATQIVPLEHRVILHHDHFNVPVTSIEFGINGPAEEGDTNHLEELNLSFVYSDGGLVVEERYSMGYTGDEGAWEIVETTNSWTPDDNVDDGGGEA